MKTFSVHLVDSGSHDGSLEIARQFPCQIQEIPPGDYYPGQVLNQAIAETNTPIIVFLNSDAVLLHAHALQGLLDPFDDESVQAAFGRQLPRPEAFPWVQRDLLHAFPPAGLPPPWLPYALPFAAMRRSAWQRHPFYTAAWGSEDSEWGYHAMKQRWKISYVPSATVMHSHNYSPAALFGRRYIEGEADAFIEQKSFTVAQALLSIGAQFTKDLSLYLKKGKLSGISTLPSIAIAKHWGYYRGHHWGTDRRLTGNTNTRQGQKMVLNSRNKN